MLKISEVSKLTGVTPRTLRYYDRLGLLPPSRATEAGYRLYDEKALAVLQQILFFKELGFPLEQIGRFLRDPAFSASEALARHRELLLLKRTRLERLIALVDRTLSEGDTMDFNAFDQTEIEQTKARYAAEVRERWGGTEAYAESERRTRTYDAAKWRDVRAGFDDIFARFAQAMDKGPGHPDAQALVAQWQAFVSDNFYPCTDEILSGLGQLYVEDARFAKTLDAYRPGLARFVSEAIALHCKA